jgi:hypothetical protein
MNPLPVQRANELNVHADGPQWLIENLWTDQAVGILGGEPKCCKSFLALDVAVSVASGAACLRRFPVLRTGPVLMFPAEDSLTIVRQRLEGICQAAGQSLAHLDVHVITAPSLRLDSRRDQTRLADTLQALRPVLLVLDPFIRLHRIDENVAAEVAPILAYLRQLQRRFQTAILLVHHAKKGADKQRPGQALRGSSDLHGWGDSNLYLRRVGKHLRLAVEHRGAPSHDDIPLKLLDHNPAPALSVQDDDAGPAAETRTRSPSQRICHALASRTAPTPFQHLRRLCRMRAETLSATTKALVRQGILVHTRQGYRLANTGHNAPVSISAAPIGSDGNGNGKRHDAAE